MIFLTSHQKTKKEDLENILGNKKQKMPLKKKKLIDIFSKEVSIN